MLPSFTNEGYLPPADYELTLDGLRSSMLAVGPPDGYPNWGRDWRAHLVDNLAVLVELLWQVGIDDIFVDGSFVEDKEHPHYGQWSGIQDKFGNTLEFPSAFRLSRRDGQPRGIVKIIKGAQS